LELTSTEIRRQQFDQVRRGFDPQEVGVFLERVATMVAERDKEIASTRSEIKRLERELDEARAAEEAVRLTMVAATKAKDEILAGANLDAGTMLESARSEAEAVVSAARREALVVLEDSRNDADRLVAAATAEQAELKRRIDLMRDIVLKTSNLLKGMASGALEDVGHAATLLEGVAGDAGGGFAFVDTPAGQAAVSVDADPVDRLLRELREVGG
jgi:cell division initiation protein